MDWPITTACVPAIVVLAIWMAPASAAAPVTCAVGFTKVLESGGSAVCRRSASVGSSSLAEALSQMWWSEARCSGSASDKQTAVSQNSAGDWTVTMRFLCKRF